MRVPVLAWILAAACTTAPVEAPAQTVHLPDDWSDLDPVAFEAWLDGELPLGRPTELSEESLSALATSLAAHPQSALRSAIVLGRSETDAALQVLAERLEQRVPHPDRNADAGDVTAAFALFKGYQRSPGPRSRLLGLLEALAVPGSPHPDLEVRVECAGGALAGGRESVVPFLLQVIRIGTWDGQQQVTDFTASATTAWARDRAARALADYCGVPSDYRADGSIPDRQAHADRLEQLWRSSRGTPRPAGAPSPTP